MVEPDLALVGSRRRRAPSMRRAILGSPQSDLRQQDGIGDINVRDLMICQREGLRSHRVQQLAAVFLTHRNEAGFSAAPC